MKRFIILVAVAVSMMVCVPLQQAEGGGKVLLIPREGKSAYFEISLEKEVGVMVGMLKDAGFEVEVATLSGQPMVEGSSALKPDLRLADVKLTDYAGIIMPCMAAGLRLGPPVAPEAIAIVKQAVAEGKPVAAQLGSVYVLAEAGVLKGKQFAFMDDPSSPYGSSPKDTRFVDAIYGGNGVVQDGNIITSGISPFAAFNTGHPDQTSNLTRVFIYELNRR